MAPPDPSYPFRKFRLSDETYRKLRTRAAYLEMSISDYVTYLVENDAADMFQRIDRPPANHGGRT